MGWGLRHVEYVTRRKGQEFRQRDEDRNTKGMADREKERYAPKRDRQCIEAGRYSI